MQTLEGYLIPLYPNILVHYLRYGKLLIISLVFQDCDDVKAMDILDQMIDKGALESCVGPNDLMHVHPVKMLNGKKGRSSWYKHCRLHTIAAVPSQLAKNVWELLSAHVTSEKSGGARAKNSPA